MTSISFIQTIAVVFVCCIAAAAQTPKNLTKDNLSFRHNSDALANRHRNLAAIYTDFVHRFKIRE